MSKGQDLVFFPFVTLFRIFLGLTLCFIISVTWPIILYGYLLSILAPTFRPDLGSILSPQSCFYLPISNTRLNTIIQFRVSGKLNYPRLVTQVTERCILLKDKDTGRFKYPEFQQYVTSWLGYPFWKNEERFDMNRHVRHVFLEGEKEVDQEYQTARQTPFTPNQSPWEIIFLETKENQKFHCIWFKFQHVLGEGDSLSKALIEAADSKVQQFQEEGQGSLSFWTQMLSSLNFILGFFCVPHHMKMVRPVPAQLLESRSQPRLTSSDEGISFTQSKRMKFGAVSAFAVLVPILTGVLRRKFLKEEVDDPPSRIQDVTPGILAPVPAVVPRRSKSLNSSLFEFDLLHKVQFKNFRRTSVKS